MIIFFFQNSFFLVKREIVFKKIRWSCEQNYEKNKVENNNIKAEVFIKSMGGINIKMIILLQFN